ncbi:FadR/GntR family transcriptional regulator [Paraglaciecola hydrolytica]|uniref:FadR/GntR family transcriptional regulator n=1 Tax=Paraglaciecola hydrolytica TaxID=1799789 RepID=UPI000B250F7D|nr:FadR/GntR family transcriptional regulator [Paraglaciecola hydrolytica]
MSLPNELKGLQLQIIKSDRLYLKVAEQLNKLIDDGAIKPGQRFPSERELAEQLGVSRPTIREAMIALELSGVIEIRTGSGIYVTKQPRKREPELNDKGVGPFEILEIRYIIESEACALAAARITNEQIEELRKVVDEMEEEEKKPDASEKADQKFHSIIAQACQNSAIASVVEWLWDLRNESQLSTAFLQRIREEGVHPSISEHRKILQALEQRNPEKARTAMKIHIENATTNAAAHFNK